MKNALKYKRGIYHQIRFLYSLSFVVICFQESIAQNIALEPYLNNAVEKSYEDIRNMELEALDMEDWKSLRRITKVHLLKAKAEKNDLEKARAFYYQVIIEPPKVGIMYADSIIMTTEHSMHPNYPAVGYALKGHIYYEKGNFESALYNYLKAYNFAIKKENVEQQREFALAIAAIRNINGQHYAAAELYNQTLNLLKNESNYEEAYYEDYITLLYNLSITHLRLQEIDSAKHFAEKGIILSHKQKDVEYNEDFIMLDAQINYYDENYKAARDTLLRYVDQLEGTSKAIKLYYLGKIEDKLNNRASALRYFLKVDSIVNETDDPFFELKDVYHQLTMQAILEDKRVQQVEYIGKLMAFDSILSSERENILNQTVANYDMPYLKQQKRKAEEELITRRRYTIFFGAFVAISMVSGFHFYRRNSRMNIRIKKLLAEGAPKEVVSFLKPVENTFSLPVDIKDDLLQKLEDFENSGRFLNKELDMSTLAQELETNTTYLSQVVNSYKGLSFPNYLKDLRITYAIEQLNKDPQLLKYNYQGLAEMFGFKTGESFSKAFYQKTQVYPSKFLKELKQRKNDGYL